MASEHQLDYVRWITPLNHMKMYVLQINIISKLLPFAVTHINWVRMRHRMRFFTWTMWPPTNSNSSNGSAISIDSFPLFEMTTYLVQFLIINFSFEVCNFASLFGWSNWWSLRVFHSIYIGVSDNGILKKKKKKNIITLQIIQYFLLVGFCNKLNFWR